MSGKQLPEFRDAIVLRGSSNIGLVRCVGFLLLISLFASACASITGSLTTNGSDAEDLPDFITPSTLANPFRAQMDSRRGIDFILSKGVQFERISLE